MTCTLCSQPFTITERDAEFYQKMDVPSPTLCPVCRFRKKALWRNERTLYARTCDLCNKSMVSMFPQETKYTVYCKTCYYSDRWDPYQYGIVYDPSRPFLDQFGELFVKVPKAATLTSEPNFNSDYQNWAGHNKDCYMVFNSGQNEMVMYSRGMRSCRDIVDCYYGVNAELCYESVNVHDSSRVRYSDNVRSCLDSWFLRDCTGCANCFGCVNLRYKDYHFFNEPLSKDDYEKRLSAIFGSHARLAETQQKFLEFSKNHPFRANHNMKSEDCIGDYIVDSKDCSFCFEVDKDEHCSYNYFTKTAKDAWDCIGYGYDSELLYECMATGFSHHMIGCIYADQCSECEYCNGMRSCLSCIGCDGLNKAQFTILNMIYPEEKYRLMREQIIASMKADGSWGNCFPLSLAPFAFNETIALDYYPLTKEDALRHGYAWKDDLPQTTRKETLNLEDISDHIRDVQDTITKEILACGACGRNYKIVVQELALYRQLNVPIPRKCFNCRHADRLARRGPMTLFDQLCSQCSKHITTTISPDQGVTILCDECYTTHVA